MQVIYHPEIDQTSLIMKETSHGITVVPKKISPSYFLKINDVPKESQISTKIKYILLIQSQEKLFLGYISTMWVRKEPQCC